MPGFRYFMSRILNFSFPAILSLPVRDMSSGYRLYRASVLRETVIKGQHFDALQELLLNAYVGGWKVREVPFAYQPRGEGRSKASLLRFARSYLQTLGRMWLVRNDVSGADYEEHAFDSRNTLQRLWHRSRHNIILSMTQNYIVTQIFSVGGGSSRVLLDLPGAVGLDTRFAKLRYLHHYRTNPLVLGNIQQIPFCDSQFDCVICCGVIEHMPSPVVVFRELLRVLHPDGMLVLGTPDYGRRRWRLLVRIRALIYRKNAPVSIFTYR